MKLSSPFCGFLLLGLWASASYADISLTLRNKQYLPPPIQELPVQDDYYNTQDNIQPKQQFEENNYANSKYEIFEVHNHYDQSKGNDENKQKLIETNFANNNYSPLRKTSAIRIEHINAPADFPIDDPNLDASYVSFAAGNDVSNQQIIVQHERKGYSYTEKRNDENNYSGAKKSFSALKEYQSQRHAADTFEGPGYLPPKYISKYLRQRSFGTAQDYQTTQQLKQKSDIHSSIKMADYSLHKKNFNKVDRFNGPGYLSSHQSEPLQPLKNSASKSSDELAASKLSSYKSRYNSVPSEVYKGPDYLPPHHHSSSKSLESFEQKSDFKDSNYFKSYQLDPHQSEPKFLSESAKNFIGPDYLPPLEENAIQQQNEQFAPRDPDYLSPANSDQQNQPARYKGADYLPPNPSLVASLQNSLPQHQGEQSNYQSYSYFKGLENLPPRELQNDAIFKGPAYLPPLENDIQTHEYPIQSLPDGYDFQKPPNAERAIEELHKLPEYSPNSPLDTNREEQFSNSLDYVPMQEKSNLKDKISSADHVEFENEKQDLNFLHSQEFFSNVQLSKASERYLPVYHFQRTADSEQTAKQQQNIESQLKHLHTDTESVTNFPNGYNAQTLVNSEQATIPSQEQRYSMEENSDSSKNYKDFKYSASPQPQSQIKRKPIITQSLLPPIIAPQPFRGTDYLPPHDAPKFFQDSENLPVNDALPSSKTSDFLAPTAPSKSFKRSDHLSSSAVSKSFKGADYLPPNAVSQPLKGPGYLPPSVTSQPFNAPEYLPRSNTLQSIKAPDYLSSNDESQSFKSTDYFPPSDIAQSFKDPDHLPQGTAKQPFKGYEYSPPSAASQSFNDLSHLPRSSPSHSVRGPNNLPSDVQTQPVQNSNYLPHTTILQPLKDYGSKVINDLEYSPKNSDTEVFKSSNYSPHVASKQKIFPLAKHQSSEASKVADNFAPINDQATYQTLQQNKFEGANFPPPTMSTTAEDFKPTVVYPLRNYMTNVTPYDRYGSRRPFTEYKLQSKTTLYPTSKIISPMYTESVSRPDYYAPTMHYSNNVINDKTSDVFKKNTIQSASALNQQAQQVLQSFMPEDLRKTITSSHFNNPSKVSESRTVLQATKPVKAEIRTVQIVNPNAVKTFKVLESLDHNGVKTIKILGHTNDIPSGDHSVVKVVSSSHDQSVQTVKIFNDSQDVTSNANIATSIEQSNIYLSPRSKRNSNMSSKTETTLH